MQPHSTIFRSSHFNDTGFVKKSLHPAAKAETLSLCKEEAVRATMMTEDRNGDDGTGLSVASSLLTSPAGVEGKIPMLLFFSSFRISFVASIPSITGSWISICGYMSVTTISRWIERTKIKWNPPVRHFSTASRPSLADWCLIFFFLKNMLRMF